MINSNLCKARYPIAAALSLILSGTAFADKTVALQDPKTGQIKPVPTTGGDASTTTPWGGLGWGIGLGANFDVTGKRVTNATIVNNVVRVDDATSNVNVGFVLEAHYFLRNFFFTGDGQQETKCGTILGDFNCMQVAWGPFVAVQVGGGTALPKPTDIATAYALGLMVGLRHPNMTTSPTSSWNFGVGVRVDPNTRVLGDGIVANQPLPNQETAIRYKNEPRFGLMLLSSFSF
jgi:hypothetical protein